MTCPHRHVSPVSLLRLACAPQVGQIFWNMLLTEAMALAMLFDSEPDGPVQPLTIVILACIGAGTCCAIGLLCRMIFRWGNSHRYFKKRKLNMGGPSQREKGISLHACLLERFSTIIGIGN